MDTEELRKLLLEDKLSYEEIGRREGVTGAAIKKRARRAGIYLQKITYTGHNGEMKTRQCSNRECDNLIAVWASRCCSVECARAYRKQKLLDEDFDSLGYYSKKSRVLLEQENKCNKCGNSHWLGQPMTLEFEHKDGNHFNNERSNLECLCPNCHAQTTTWRGRNRNRYINLGE